MFVNVKSGSKYKGLGHFYRDNYVHRRQFNALKISVGLSVGKPTKVSATGSCSTYSHLYNYDATWFAKLLSLSLLG